MANKLPAKSSVLYGTEEDKPERGRPKLMTLKDLVAPQTQELFTLHYEMIPIGKRRRAG
jgi:hypothetical protein